MRNARFRNPKARAAAALLLIFAWMSSLAGTDSYYSVYALCGVAGVFCFCRNSRRTPQGENPRGAAIAALVFAGATVGANYPLFLPFGLVSLGNLLCALGGGMVVAYEVLTWAFHELPLTLPREERSHPGRVFALAFGSKLCVDLSYLFFVSFPGVLTRDSITTVSFIENGIRNNVMPFWHTETVGLFYNMGKALFGSANAGAACWHVAQGAFMAACCAYALVTLYQKGLPKWVLVGVWGLYTLLPYQIVYSSTLWKDVIFGGAMLLLLTALYRSLTGLGAYPWCSGLCLVLGGLGLCLWRTNGLMTYGAAFVLLFFPLRKTHKGTVLLLAGVLAAGWLLTGPALNALEAEPMDPVEGLSVPLQQMARVAAQGRELEPEDLALLEQAFYLENLAEKYDPSTVDPIKFEVLRRENLPYIRENWGAYLSLYLRLGLRYPGDYLAAWVEETKGYWNGGYEFWRYTHGIDTNDLGLTPAAGDNPISRGFAAWFRLLETPPMFQPLFSMGLQVWLMFGCLLLNLWKKRREWLLTVPLAVLIAGLWLATPVYAEFRYAYPMILTMPLVLGVSLYGEAER